MYKKDFPIFDNQPELVYLDSAATTQKPQTVVEKVTTYLTHHNANIHRGIYDIAEHSEELYYASKQAYAGLIKAETSEIIYSYNATYCFNMITQSLARSQYLKKGDTILLGIRDHHANIVPRQMLAQQIGCQIEYIGLTDNYELDRDDFEKKYTDTVKVVSLGGISNVTGTIIPMKKIRAKLRDETLYIIDGSQMVGKLPVDVTSIGCDMMIATAHKMMALTGLGMLYMKKKWIRKLLPSFGGGGMIEDVTTQGHTYNFGSEKREPGTPNIIGAVSLGAAINYLQQISIPSIQQHDADLTYYTLQQFHQRKKTLTLYGKPNCDQRVGIFSFSCIHQSNNIRIGEIMAMHNIAIRCGGHCTHPLRHSIEQSGSCRLSLYVYNTKQDIDRFFSLLDTMN